MSAQYLTVDEAALILRVDPHTIRNWLRKNILKGRKLGKGRTAPWRIPVNEVVAKGDRQ